MKTALVTGASGGIGGRIARTLADNGYVVAATYNTGAPLQYHDCVAFQCDVAKYSHIEKLYADVLEQFGHIDVVVNNAGTSYNGLVQDMTERDINTIIATDLTSTIYSTKFAASHMVSRHAGSIINISSVWGVAGASFEAVYSAAKGGIISFTKAMAKELGYSGIRVNCISPGVINTKMLECYSEEDLHSLADETPLSRLGQPTDIAQVVLFLAGEQASFITGQNLVVDGGFIL